MSIDYESFLWGVGFGRSKRKRVKRRKRIHRYPKLKLESIRVENNSTIVALLRNLSEDDIVINRVQFLRIIKEPRIERKFLIFKKVTTKENTVNAIEITASSLCNESKYEEKIIGSSPIPQGYIIEVKINLKENLKPNTSYELIIECCLEEELNRFETACLRGGQARLSTRKFTYTLETDDNINFKKQVKVAIENVKHIYV